MRDKQIILKVSADEKKLFTDEAAKRFMTLSAYMRYCTHENIKSNK